MEPNLEQQESPFADKRELSADEVQALGLDPTGRDGDRRFPYTMDNLTDDEKSRLRQYNESQ